MKSVLSFLAGAVAFVLSQSGVLGLLPHSAQVVVGLAGTVLTVLGIRGASSAPPTVTAILDSLGKGWKTAVGILVAAIGVLAAPDMANLLGPQVAHVVTLVGEALTALGLYHAQTAGASGA
jgi:hypothetical protein